jgi:DNA-binding transcriptional LysR family regulator
VPTEAGETVAARARRVLAEVDGVRGELDELRGLVRGRISVGALLPAGEIEVTTLLANFRHRFDGIEVGLREGTAGDLMNLLVAGELDVAFMLVAGELGDELESLRLGTEQVVAAFPPGTAPKAKAVTADDLAGVALAAPRSGSAIKREVDRFFAAAGGELMLSLESSDPYLIRCLVSDGFGPAMLPASLAQRQGPAVETRELRPPIELPVCLVWQRGRELSPAANAFVEFVREA